jgi:hypothetical protein
MSLAISLQSYDLFRNPVSFLALKMQKGGSSCVPQHSRRPLIESFWF